MAVGRKFISLACLVELILFLSVVLNLFFKIGAQKTFRKYYNDKPIKLKSFPTYTYGIKRHNHFSATTYWSIIQFWSK